MKLRLLTIGCTAFFGLAHPVVADYQAGVEAYQAKKFAAAMAEWMPLAEGGDAIAQNAVGALYDHGLGVEENDAEAAAWYQRAAEQGLPIAMRNLGEKYLTGHGVPFDPAQGEDWLRKAASLGDPVAIQRLAAPTGQPRTAPADPQPTAMFAGGIGTGQAGQTPSNASSGAQSVSVRTDPPAANGLWLFGQWQGPSLGCPPQGGLEFTPDLVLSYYQGRVTSNLSARYSAQSDRIDVAMVGLDGAQQTYSYRRISDLRFEILSVPEAMPESMIGVVFERCGEIPMVSQVAASSTSTIASSAAATPASKPASFAEALESADPSPAEMLDPSAPAAASDQVETTSEPVPISAAEAAPALDEAPEHKLEPVAVAEQEPKTAPEPLPIAAVEPASEPPQSTSTQSQIAAVSAQPAQNTLQAGWRAFSRGDTLGAIEIWKPEAESGDVAMQLLIGSIYDYGQGVPQDDTTAIEWYRRAAAKGSAKGQFLIGAVYARSPQIQDSVKGLAWLKRAQRTLSQSGKDADGDVRATQIELLSKQVAAGMSAAQIAEAERLAANL